MTGRKQNSDRKVRLHAGLHPVWEMYFRIALTMDKDKTNVKLINYITQPKFADILFDNVFLCCWHILGLAVVYIKTPKAVNKTECWLN